MLADKFYADFRHSYYVGLRELLQALLPAFCDYERFVRSEQIEAAHRYLGGIAASGDRDKVYAWLRSNGFALAALFGRLSSVSETVPRFPAGNGWG